LKIKYYFSEAAINLKTEIFSKNKNPAKKYLQGF